MAGRTRLCGEWEGVEALLPALPMLAVRLRAACWPTCPHLQRGAPGPSASWCGSMSIRQACRKGRRWPPACATLQVLSRRPVHRHADPGLRHRLLRYPVVPDRATVRRWFRWRSPDGYRCRISTLDESGDRAQGCQTPDRTLPWTLVALSRAPEPSHFTVHPRSPTPAEAKSRPRQKGGYIPGVPDEGGLECFRQNSI